MIYSDIALNAVFLAVVLDLFLLKSRMTSNEIVMYGLSDITGQRLAGAPIEDLLFGFSMILLTISAWEFFKSRLNKE